jgi:hypothetical protein
MMVLINIYCESFEEKNTRNFVFKCQLHLLNIWLLLLYSSENNQTSWKYFFFSDNEN